MKRSMEQKSSIELVNADEGLSQMQMTGTFLRCAFKAVDLKIFVLFATTLSLAGCDELFGKPNVYKLPVARAHEKLMAAVIKPSGSGPFGRLEIETSGR